MKFLRDRATVALVIGLLAVPVALGLPDPARAVATDLDLGSASTFAVLAASTVTNAGTTVVTGDLGVSPGTAITGFGPGTLIGNLHAGDTVAAQAQADAAVAYSDGVVQVADFVVAGDLGGETLPPGVYSVAAAIAVTGIMTLDAQGDADAIWVFQVGSTLTTAAASTMLLINGAQACNVFWLVGTSATLGTNSVLAGSILAQASVTVTTGVVLDGRALALGAAVTLDTNAITRAECAVIPTPTPTPSPTPTPPPTPTPSPTPTPPPTPTPTLVVLLVAPSHSPDPAVTTDLAAPTPPQTSTVNAAPDDLGTSTVGAAALVAGLLGLTVGLLVRRRPAGR